MFAATIASSVLLAVALIPSARGKLVGDHRQSDGMRAVNFPIDKMWLLGAAELGGAAGLTVGLFWWPLGVAAAVSLIAYFGGALAYLLRAGITHAKALAPAAVLLLVATATLVLRLATSTPSPLTRGGRVEDPVGPPPTHRSRVAQPQCCATSRRVYRCSPDRRALSPVMMAYLQCDSSSIPTWPGV
jgi:hypothetical protein